MGFPSTFTRAFSPSRTGESIVCIVRRQVLSSNRETIESEQIPVFRESEKQTMKALLLLILVSGFSCCLSGQSAPVCVCVAMEGIHEFPDYAVGEFASELSKQPLRHGGSIQALALPDSQKDKIKAAAAQHCEYLVLLSSIESLQPILEAAPSAQGGTGENTPQAQIVTLGRPTRDELAYRLLKPGTTRALLQGTVSSVAGRREDRVHHPYTLTVQAIARKIGEPPQAFRPCGF
jgi:hypothetical protein